MLLKTRQDLAKDALYIIAKNEFLNGLGYLQLSEILKQLNLSLKTPIQTLIFELERITRD